jgi:sugar phosphate isomerase/epimerase
MAEVIAWVDRIGSPAFQAMLDTQQLATMEPSVEAGLRAAQGRAKHIHLYDPSRRPPGVGIDQAALDWPRIAEVLSEEGFRGSGSVVIAAEGDPEAGARASAAYLRRLFNR